MREELARVGAGDASTILESELVQEEPNLEWALPLPAVRWVETRMRAIRDPSGALTGGVHGTTQDITARKLADLSGRDSEQRLRQAQRMAEIGSFEVDCRTRLVTWSPQLYRLFAVQTATVSGDLDYVLALLPADDAAALVQHGRCDRRRRPAARARAPVPARRRAAACPDPARTAYGRRPRQRRARDDAGHHRAHAGRGRDPAPRAAARLGRRRGDRHRPDRNGHALEQLRGAALRLGARGDAGSPARAPEPRRRRRPGADRPPPGVGRRRGCARARAQGRHALSRVCPHVADHR